MKITHKMTMADKLREVLWVKKWKQKELAAKLGVSEKTVSFWVNGKKQPTGYRFDEINKMYSDVTGDEVGKNVSEIIRDYQAGDGLDESEKVFTIDEKIYYEAKCLVLAKEKDNHRYVYLYPSVGGEKDGWYKVGGRSLLFYKNLLASRLGREAKIRDDTDKVHRFYNGIASVRWGDKLMIEAEGLGYKASRIEYDVIVIDLKRDYSDAEIKTMMGVITAERGVPFLGAMIHQGYILPGERLKRNFREACIKVQAGAKEIETLVSYLGHVEHFDKIMFLSDEFERIGLEYNY